MYKIFPWAPNPHTYDTTTSLSPKDYDFLASQGFNMVRLGTMWPGYGVSATTFNASYLDLLEEIVNGLGSRGIYTLLDAHQDVGSRSFCGEGIPPWAVKRDPSGLFPFPQPVVKSIPLNAQGVPELEACLSRGFFEYYFTYDVGYAFQALYDNTDGIQDAFGAFWAGVAERFKTNPYVLGYELINEPWAGNIYKDPALLEFGKAGEKNLAPMYEALAAAIRKVDNETIIFFEDAVSNQARAGLHSVPGGEAYRSKSCYSYHVYCAPTDKSGDPSSVPVCDGVDDYFERNKIADVKALGGGGFMTEFGAMLESDAESGALDALLGLADKHLQSTSYWQYKSYHDLTTASQPFDESFFRPDGSYQTGKIRTLSRTYAQATAGVPQSMSFDTSSADFTFSYAADAQLAANGVPTIIFLNQDLWYAPGYDVVVSPPGAATFTSPKPNFIHVVASSSVVDGAIITVSIHRKQ